MLKKIWLADDDPDDSELFVEAITEIDKSITCHCAVNGRDLIMKLNGDKTIPELIFLDVNMPEMNGWECLSYLKKNVAYKNIPVIIYSTSSAQKNYQNAIELGAFGFYEKPANYLVLKDFLKILATNYEDKEKMNSHLKKSSVHKFFFN